ncbi:hypothetical protein CDAR_92461 [Caerostris darwini]|uniref:C2H2-type domain-containing protein n=1 Tax=Caerostris darwini TaxID=1538125 RepID=A0AAV4PFT7_9ARAC|nr:hypothetical protein CDAR_92461 [Caerostris darwini]
MHSPDMAPDFHWAPRTAEGSYGGYSLNNSRVAKKHSEDKYPICSVCGKLFSSKWHLSRHFLIHTGARPHQCDICKKRFRLKDHLKTHMIVHN